MLVSKNHHAPNAGQWNIVRIGYARFGFALGMLIPCCLSCFCSHWVLNANAVSGGKRAYCRIISIENSGPYLE